MRVLVIGGGAAGCMAAACAAERGAEVVILEKNQNIGKKLRITGKGRCNVTNACDMEGLMQNIPRGGRFLYSAFSHCLPQDVMDWFEARGVRLKVERGNRVFPESDQAAEIVETLRRTLDSLGVTIVHDTVTGLACDDRGVTGAVCGPRTYSADAVILAAGGATYPGTGSTGDGFTLAQSVGHTVTPLQPSLVPLETLERDCAEMMGISLKNVRLTLRRDDRAVFTEMGEMLFTHFGVSGPLVLSASAHWEQGGRWTLHIDLKPALSEEQLDRRIQRDIAAAPNKQIPSLIRGLLPAGMAAPVLGRLQIPARTPCNAITREQRHRLVLLLKDFAFTVRGTRPMEEGIVTRGGVDLREVAPKTMASKIVPGLYLAGELLDCDAYTGGFNLQIAWATGMAAGYAAAEGR